jgi:translation initiation factor IF-1
MPKIRGVKPEFWTDDAIVDLSIPARLLFIGLWNYACDNGHLDDKPKQIKMRILPADDVNVDQLLDELETHGRVNRKGGTITIPKFSAHQRPHKRWWTTCDKPGCVVPDDAPPQGRNSGTTVEQPLSNGSATVTDGDVTDGDGDSESSVATEPTARKRAARKPEKSLPGDWQPKDKHREFAASKHLDLEREAFRFRNHATANDRRQRDWDSAFTNWLDKAFPVPAPTRTRATGIPEGW